jgi:hypothetical protein
MDPKGRVSWICHGKGSHVPCACRPDCKCDTISQNPGNGSCGKKVMEAKAKAKKQA